MCSAPQFALPASLDVVAWTDPVVEANGFGPDHPYIEGALVPVLGPSATLLWKNLARQVLAAPAVAVDTDELLACLGLGQGRGRNSVGARTIARTVCFNLVRRLGADHSGLAVRTAAAPLPEHRARNLPGPALRHHQEATRAQGPRFRLGKLHVTQTVVAAMAAAGADPTFLLSRHQRGDWGYVTFDTALANNDAVTTGQPVRSVYPLADDGAANPAVVVIETNGARTATEIRTGSEDPRP